MIDEKVKQKGREVSALKVGIRQAVDAIEAGHPRPVVLKYLNIALKRAERIEGRGLEQKV